MNETLDASPGAFPRICGSGGGGGWAKGGGGGLAVSQNEACESEPESKPDAFDALPPRSSLSASSTLLTTSPLGGGGGGGYSGVNVEGGGGGGLAAPAQSSPIWITESLIVLFSKAPSLQGRIQKCRFSENCVFMLAAWKVSFSRSLQTESPSFENEKCVV